MHEMDALGQHLKRNARVVKLGVGALLVSGAFVVVAANGLIQDPLYVHEQKIAAKQKPQDNKATTGVLGAQTVKQYELKTGKVTETLDDLSLAPDEKHVSIELTIKNISEHDIQIAPALQMLVANQKGGLYRLDAALADSTKDMSGPLAPGQTRSGAVDFAMSKQTVAKKLLFQLDASSQKDSYQLE